MTNSIFNQHTFTSSVHIQYIFSVVICEADSSSPWPKRSLYTIHTCRAVVPLNGSNDGGYLKLSGEDQHQRLGVSAALDHVLDPALLKLDPLVIGREHKLSLARDGKVSLLKKHYSLPSFSNFLLNSSTHLSSPSVSDLSVKWKVARTHSKGGRVVLIKLSHFLQRSGNLNTLYVESEITLKYNSIVHAHLLICLSLSYLAKV